MEEEITVDKAVAIATQFYHAGRLPEAERLCRQVLAAQGNHADALNLLGIVAYRSDNHEVAIDLIRRAIRIHPGKPEYHSNLGNVLRLAGRMDEAIAAYQTALALQPNLAEAHSNLASLLARMGRLDQAVLLYQKAIELNPKLPEAYSNLGNALTDQGQLDEAIAAYRSALVLQPDHAEVHCNLGMCLLGNGEFAAGWEGYEWRLKCGNSHFTGNRFSQPQWQGEALAGRTILLHAEQGFGDTIQFIRYAPLVAARGGRVIVECQAELISLLRQISCVNGWIAHGHPLPPFDAHSPLLSLPHAFATTLQDIPSFEPRLRVPADRVAFGQRITGHGGGKLKVGLAWQGHPGHKNDRNRSLPLSLLAPLGRVAGARFFSLQKTTASEPADGSHAGIDLVDVMPEVNDFADTAALIDHLDLVISVDTAVAHLAAAMGKPVWLLLPFSPDWRWQRTRRDSPWYPTMRLFRQHQMGNWTDVIDEVAAELGGYLRHSTLGSARGPFARPTN